MAEHGHWKDGAFLDLDQGVVLFIISGLSCVVLSYGFRLQI